MLLGCGTAVGTSPPPGASPRTAAGAAGEAVEATFTPPPLARAVPLRGATASGTTLVARLVPARANGFAVADASLATVLAASSCVPSVLPIRVGPGAGVVDAFGPCGPARAAAVAALPASAPAAGAPVPIEPCARCASCAACRPCVASCSAASAGPPVADKILVSSITKHSTQRCST